MHLTEIQSSLPGAEFVVWGNSLIFEAPAVGKVSSGSMLGEAQVSSLNLSHPLYFPEKGLEFAGQRYIDLAHAHRETKIAKTRHPKLRGRNAAGHDA